MINSLTSERGHESEVFPLNRKVSILGHTGNLPWLNGRDMCFLFDGLSLVIVLINILLRVFGAVMSDLKFHRGVLDGGTESCRAGLQLPGSGCERSVKIK